MDVDGGKYTIVVRDNGAHVDILRHGEEWIKGGSTYPQAGGKFLIAVAHELADLRVKVAACERFHLNAAALRQQGG